jgi:hypothetical protein
MRRGLMHAVLSPRREKDAFLALWEVFVSSHRFRMTESLSAHTWYGRGARHAAKGVFNEARGDFNAWSFFSAFEVRYMRCGRANETKITDYARFLVTFPSRMNVRVSLQSLRMSLCAALSIATGVLLISAILI